MRIVNSPYFLVKVVRKDQVDRKERDDVLYLHPDYVYMTRGMQCAEIVDFGYIVKSVFPAVKIGDIVLMHHFVEGKINENADDGKYFIYQDDFYNYYLVTVKSHRGRKNETYAIYDGSKIISHPEFVFLETGVIDNSIEQQNGFFTFNGYHLTREQKGGRMKEIQNEIKELTKSLMNDEIKTVIERKECEMNEISKDVNSRYYDRYLVAVDNAYLSDSFRVDSIFSKILYALNIACNTRIEFKGKEFIVAKAKYVVGLQK